MSNGPKDRLKRLNRDGIINININDVVLKSIDASDIPMFNNLSGILRFDGSDYVAKFPRYRMVVLADYCIYCYNRIHKNKVIDLNNYSSKIEFKTLLSARMAWIEVIGNPIISYGDVK